ncbi:MAG TPA: hypothetical protein VHV47_04420 [Opitutaceae bacterium]|nr:hypothetical protein [Opitutaceae bacterium]
MGKTRYFTLLMPLALRASTPAPPRDVPLRPIVALQPGPDGIYDVAGALESEQRDAIPNPFRLRNLPKPKVREVTLAVSSVLVGSRPDESSALINGRAYACGDRIEGWKIESISADTIGLSDSRFRVRLPVTDSPTTLRIP